MSLQHREYPHSAMPQEATRLRGSLPTAALETPKPTPIIRLLALSYREC